MSDTPKKPRGRPPKKPLVISEKKKEEARAMVKKIEEEMKEDRVVIKETHDSVNALRAEIQSSIDNEKEVNIVVEKPKKRQNNKKLPVSIIDTQDKSENNTPIDDISVKSKSKRDRTKKTNIVNNIAQNNPENDKVITNFEKKPRKPYTKKQTKVNIIAQLNPNAVNSPSYFMFEDVEIRGSGKEPLFNARHLALKINDKDHYKKKLKIILPNKLSSYEQESIDEIGRMAPTIFINEKQAWTYLSKSNKELAEKFQQWVYQKLIRDREQVITSEMIDEQISYYRKLVMKHAKEPNYVRREDHDAGYVAHVYIQKCLDRYPEHKYNEELFPESLMMELSRIADDHSDTYWPLDQDGIEQIENIVKRIYSIDQSNEEDDKNINEDINENSDEDYIIKSDEQMLCLYAYMEKLKNRQIPTRENETPMDRWCRKYIERIQQRVMQENK